MKQAITRYIIGMVMPMMLMLLFLTNCDKDTFRHETKVEGRIGFLDIVNAQTLIIAPGEGILKSGGTKSSGTGSSLFKITDDGLFQEIRYYRVDTTYIETEEGTELQVDSTELTNTIFPAQIVNATEEYIIATFVEEPYLELRHATQYNYLARKSDGAVFVLPSENPQLFDEWDHWRNMFKNETAASIQTDLAGNIYYIGGGTLYKLNIQDPENLTLQGVVSSTSIEGMDAPTNFRVNSAGNILYNAESGAAMKQRIRYHSGRLEYPEKTLFPYWKGFDNQIYHAQRAVPVFGDPWYPLVEKIILENEEAAYEEVGRIEHPEAELAYLSGAYIFKMKNLNKIIVPDGKVVAEVYNDEMRVRGFGMDKLGISDIRFGANSDNYFYLAGMDDNLPSLVRVDPSVFPHEATDLVPKGELDIYKMIVSANDVVTFNALRMSTGNVIIGEISPDGVITEFEEISSQVMQLVRIQ